MDVQIIPWKAYMRNATKEISLADLFSFKLSWTTVIFQKAGGTKPGSVSTHSNIPDSRRLNIPTYLFI